MPLKDPKARQEYCQAYYRKNRDKFLQDAKIYRDNNKEQISKGKTLYNKTRRYNDPVYKLKENTRRLIQLSFQSTSHKKSSKTIDILGCKPDFLYSHLILSAIKNYGYWLECEEYHIDHIIPISSAKTIEDVIRLNHYTNLQWLTPRDNIKKGAKLEHN